MATVSSEKESDFDRRFNRIAQKEELTKEESASEWAERTSNRLALRAGQTILGLPGNVKNAISKSRKSLTDFLGLPDLEEMETKALGKPEEGSWEHSIMNPPTTQQLKEQTPEIEKKLGLKPGHLEPQGEGEKFVDELTEDLTSFFLPGTSKMRMMTRIGAPVVANLAKQGWKFFGGSEETAEKIKMGVMLTTTLAGQSNPAQFAQDRITRAFDMIPAQYTVNVSALSNRLTPLYNRVSKGLGVPSKSKAIQGMEDLSKQIQNGRLPMKTLMQARDDINEWIAEAGGWDIPVQVRDRTLANLNELKTQIIKTIDENLAQRFPEAGELYRTGYEAAAVTHQSNAISNFIERNVGRKAASVGAKLLFPGLAGGAAILPKTAALGATAYPIYKSGQILYRIAESPTLAKYYQDTIRHSLEGNAPAMAKSFAKLDAELAKEEKKEQKSGKMSLEDFKATFMNKG